MKPWLLMAALAVGACDTRHDRAPITNSKAAEEILQTQGPVSKPPGVVPRPKDEAEVDRMILAGYTPHADHLHAPGVNKCPLTQGNEAVM